MNFYVIDFCDVYTQQGGFIELPKYPLFTEIPKTITKIQPTPTEIHLTISLGTF